MQKLFLSTVLMFSSFFLSAQNDTTRILKPKFTWLCKFSMYENNLIVPSEPCPVRKDFIFMNGQIIIQDKFSASEHNLSGWFPVLEKMYTGATATNTWNIAKTYFINHPDDWKVNIPFYQRMKGFIDSKCNAYFFRIILSRTHTFLECFKIGNRYYFYEFSETMNPKKLTLREVRNKLY